MRPIIWLACVLCLGCGQGAPRPPAYPESQLPQADRLAQVPDQALARPEPTAAEVWREALSHRDLETRLQAAETLGDLGEEGFAALLQGLQSESVEVRLACLRSVRRQVLVAHDDEVAPVLARLLADPHPLVRKEAVGRVSGLGGRTRAMLPELRGLAAADADLEVRALAANVIVDADAALPALVRLLSDSAPAVRKQAVLHLSGLEGDPGPALPHLQRVAAGDPDPEVRAAAEKALQRLSR